MASSPQSYPTCSTAIEGYYLPHHVGGNLEIVNGSIRANGGPGTEPHNVEQPGIHEPVCHLYGISQQLDCGRVPGREAGSPRDGLERWTTAFGAGLM